MMGQEEAKQPDNNDAITNSDLPNEGVIQSIHLAPMATGGSDLATDDLEGNTRSSTAEVGHNKAVLEVIAEGSSLHGVAGPVPLENIGDTTDTDNFDLPTAESTTDTNTCAKHFEDNTIAGGVIDAAVGGTTAGVLQNKGYVPDCLICPKLKSETLGEMENKIDRHETESISKSCHTVEDVPVKTCNSANKHSEAISNTTADTKNGRYDIYLTKFEELEKEFDVKVFLPVVDDVFAEKVDCFAVSKDTVGKGGIKEGTTSEVVPLKTQSVDPEAKITEQVLQIENDRKPALDLHQETNSMFSESIADAESNGLKVGLAQCETIPKKLDDLSLIDSENATPEAEDMKVERYDNALKEVVAAESEDAEYISSRITLQETKDSGNVASMFEINENVEATKKNNNFDDIVSNAVLLKSDNKTCAESKYNLQTGNDAEFIVSKTIATESREERNNVIESFSQEKIESVYKTIEKIPVQSEHEKGADKEIISQEEDDPENRATEPIFVKIEDNDIKEDIIENTLKDKIESVHVVVETILTEGDYREAGRNKSILLAKGESVVAESDVKKIDDGIEEDITDEKSAQERNDSGDRVSDNIPTESTSEGEDVTEIILPEKIESIHRAIAESPTKCKDEEAVIEEPVSLEGDDFENRAIESIHFTDKSEDDEEKDVTENISLKKTESVHDTLDKSLVVCDHKEMSDDTSALHETDGDSEKRANGTIFTESYDKNKYFENEMDCMSVKSVQERNDSENRTIEIGLAKNEDAIADEGLSRVSADEDNVKHGIISKKTVDKHCVINDGNSAIIEMNTDVSDEDVSALIENTRCTVCEVVPVMDVDGVDEEKKILWLQNERNEDDSAKDLNYTADTGEVSVKENEEKDKFIAKPQDILNQEDLNPGSNVVTENLSNAEVCLTDLVSADNHASDDVGNNDPVRRGEALALSNACKQKEILESGENSLLSSDADSSEKHTVSILQTEAIDQSSARFKDADEQSCPTELTQSSSLIIESQEHCLVGSENVLGINCCRHNDEEQIPGDRTSTLLSAKTRETASELEQLQDIHDSNIPLEIAMAQSEGAIEANSISNGIMPLIEREKSIHVDDGSVTAIPSLNNPDAEKKELVKDVAVDNAELPNYSFSDKPSLSDLKLCFEDDDLGTGLLSCTKKVFPTVSASQILSPDSGIDDIPETEAISNERYSAADPLQISDDSPVDRLKESEQHSVNKASESCESKVIVTNADVTGDQVSSVQAAESVTRDYLHTSAKSSTQSTADIVNEPEDQELSVAAAAAACYDLRFLDDLDSSEFNPFQSKRTLCSSPVLKKSPSSHEGPVCSDSVASTSIGEKAAVVQSKVVSSGHAVNSKDVVAKTSADLSLSSGVSHGHVPLCFTNF